MNLTLETKIATNIGNEITLKQLIEAMKQKLPPAFTINHSSPFLGNDFGFLNSEGYMVIDGQRHLLTYSMLVRFMANNGLIQRITPIESYMQEYTFK